jgi:hypothetical protein
MSKVKYNRLPGYSELVLSDKKLWDNVCPRCKKRIEYLQFYIMVERIEEFAQHKEKTFHYAHSRCIKK